MIENRKYLFLRSLHLSKEWGKVVEEKKKLKSLIGGIVFLLFFLSVPTFAYVVVKVAGVFGKNSVLFDIFTLGFSLGGVMYLVHLTSKIEEMIDNLPDAGVMAWLESRGLHQEEGEVTDD